MQRSRALTEQLLFGLKQKVDAIEREIQTAQTRIKAAEKKEAAIVQTSMIELQKRRDLLVELGKGLADSSAVSQGILFTLLQNLAYIDGDGGRPKHPPALRIQVPGAYTRFRPVV